MNRNISEIPDKWVILKLKDTFYKVFATWNGGYLSGDSWKINSGISKIEQDSDSYYIYGFSGSCYKCNKKAYGIANSYGNDILNSIMERGGNDFELMEDIEDWSKILE